MSRGPIARPGDDLHGIRVLITRAEADIPGTRDAFERAGASVYSLPTIAIRLLTDLPEVAVPLRAITTFDWIAFTSRNAVRATFGLLPSAIAANPDFPRIGAVGAATIGELHRFGAKVTVTGDGSGARSLARAIVDTDVRGKRVLLPSGNLTSGELSSELVAAGAHVTSIRVYETRPPAFVEESVMHELISGQIDVVTFASPSAFLNLVALDRERVTAALRTVRLVCIGRTTAQALIDAGFEPAGVAASSSAAALVDEVRRIFSEEHFHEP